MIFIQILYIFHHSGNNKVQRIQTEIQMRKLSNSYSENVMQIDKLLRVEENFDILKKTVRVGEDELTFYYLDGFVKDGVMQKLMLSLSGQKGTVIFDSKLSFFQTSLSTPEAERSLKNSHSPLRFFQLSRTN